jgi:hypothetical protein
MAIGAGVRAKLREAAAAVGAAEEDDAVVVVARRRPVGDRRVVPDLAAATRGVDDKLAASVPSLA